MHGEGQKVRFFDRRTERMIILYRAFAVRIQRAERAIVLFCADRDLARLRQGFDEIVVKQDSRILGQLVAASVELHYGICDRRVIERKKHGCDGNVVLPGNRQRLALVDALRAVQIVVAKAVGMDAAIALILAFFGEVLRFPVRRFRMHRYNCSEQKNDRQYQRKPLDPSVLCHAFRPL